MAKSPMLPMRVIPVFILSRCRRPSPPSERSKPVFVPLQIGDRLNLTIDDIAFGGEGVGRVNDFVVFVPFVLVGEEVAAEVIELKKHFARARLLRIEKKS